MFIFHLLSEDIVNNYSIYRSSDHLSAAVDILPPVLFEIREEEWEEGPKREIEVYGFLADLQC